MKIPVADRSSRTRGTSLGRSRRRRGAALVEFAVVSPLLFFFFFAAFEFCRVAMIRHTADNAVYESCRTAIVPGATAADIRSCAEDVLGTIGLQQTTINVIPAVIEEDTPQVTVMVSIPVSENTFVPPQFTGGQTIDRTLTMTREVAR